MVQRVNDDKYRNLSEKNTKCFLCFDTNVKAALDEGNTHPYIGIKYR